MDSIPMSTLREARGRIRVEGLDLAWGLWPGRARPVIALHGVTATYASFVGVAEQLAGRRPLLGLDLRGRGDSDKPEGGPYGMERHARDVAAAIAAFDLGPSLIVGHSMGAFVAAALAAAYPALVSGVVLVDGGLPLEPPPGIEPAAMLDTLLGPQMARLRTSFAGLDAYLDHWRAMAPFQGDRWNAWVERYLDYDLGPTASGWRPKASEAAVRADFADLLDTGRLRRRLAEVKVPTLLLRAGEGFDPGTPPLLPDALVAREGPAIADLTVRLLADTTHYTVVLGKAGAATVADAIVEWSRRCD